jgi:YD repeat-containing protein
MKRLLLAACLVLAVASLLPAQTAQRTATATIAAGASLSSAIRIEAGTLTKIKVPVMTAASLTVLESLDGTTYTQVYDQYGTLVTITTGDGTAARTIILSAGDWWGTRYIKFQSGTVAVPVVQVSAIAITAIYK